MIALKYIPKTCSDIIGQDEALLAMRSFVENFRKNKKKALLIHGPAGVGKTSSVVALAHDLDLELVELNASDSRNKGSMQSIVGESGKQHSLFSRGKILFIDEVDGVSGNSDRGGLQGLIELFDEVKFPVIIATSDIDLEKLESLKAKCELVEFVPVNYVLIASFLEKVCKLEGISADLSHLKQVARNVDGDVRAALLDLDVLTVNNVVNPALLDVVGRISRDAIESVVVKVLKSSSLDLANDALANSDVDVVDLSYKNVPAILFRNADCIRFGIEENLPYEYESKDLGNAFMALSDSDVFHGRISRWQYYRFLVYVQGLVASVSIHKSSKNSSQFSYRSSYRSPKYNKGLWFMLNKRRELVAKKIASCSFMTYRQVNRDLFYYRFILKHNLGEGVVSEFDFDEKDVAWLQK